MKLERELAFEDIGLESIDVAELVVRLDAEYGMDPVRAGRFDALGSLGNLIDLAVATFRRVVKW